MDTPPPRLTVEFLPQTSWFDNVRNRLTKTEWDYLRNHIYDKAKHVCEICGGKGSKWPVECHEIWEFDDVKMIQVLKGLQALCPTCHAVKHIDLDPDDYDKYQKVIRQLCEVNSWSEVEAIEYLAECKEIYEWRNAQDWAVNLEALDKLLEPLHATGHIRDHEIKHPELQIFDFDFGKKKQSDTQHGD